MPLPKNQDLPTPNNSSYRAGGGAPKAPAGLPFGPPARRRAMVWLLPLVMLYQLPPALSQSDSDQSTKTAPVRGGVRKFVTGANRQPNGGPGLRSETPAVDPASPAPYPLHAEQFGSNATDAAPPGLSSGINTSALQPFPLHADRFGGYALQSPPPGLSPQSASMDSNPQQAFLLRAQRYSLDSNQIQSLAKYDLEIIIDRSLSMRQRDCPGGLSRWEWCGYQAEDMARALNPFVPSGMTISRFAYDFDVHERASVQQVAAIMEQPDFQRGTRLSLPLESRLDACFRRQRPGGKPVLIAVITDGIPWPPPEPMIVRDVLVRASQRMQRPDEVKVVFLQIGGHDRRGERYLLDLGNNLVGYGARFQFVQTVTFYELMQIGLARALVYCAQRIG